MYPACQSGVLFIQFLRLCSRPIIVKKCSVAIGQNLETAYPFLHDACIYRQRKHRELCKRFSVIGTETDKKTGASPTAMFRTRTGTTSSTSTTAITPMTRTRTSAPVWKFLATKEHHAPFCVTEASHQVVCFEISTSCLEMRRYVFSPTTSSSCSERSKCLRTSVLTRSISSVGRFA